MRDYNKEFQDKNGRRYAYDFDQVLRLYMVKTFQPFYPSQGKALELGCFQGGFTELLVPSFDDLTVVEASNELLGIVKKRFGEKVRFINSTFEALDLPPEYEAIFLVHTLEHLDSPADVLRKIGTWLTPTGRLFIAVPNAMAASRQIAVEMGLIEHNCAVTEGEREHGHRKTYSFDSLQCDISQTGLRIESRGGVFFKPLANFQFDKLMGAGVISQGYLDGCYALGMRYPDLCASIYAVCRRP